MAYVTSIMLPPVPKPADKPVKQPHLLQDINTLPAEIIAQLCQTLDAHSLSHFAQTNSRHNAIASEKLRALKQQATDTVTLYTCIRKSQESKNKKVHLSRETEWRDNAVRYHQPSFGLVAHHLSTMPSTFYTTYEAAVRLGASLIEESLIVQITLPRTQVAALFNHYEVEAPVQAFRERLALKPSQIIREEDIEALHSERLDLDPTRGLKSYKGPTYQNFTKQEFACQKRLLTAFDQMAAWEKQEPSYAIRSVVTQARLDLQKDTVEHFRKNAEDRKEDLKHFRAASIKIITRTERTLKEHYQWQAIKKNILLGIGTLGISALIGAARYAMTGKFLFFQSNTVEDFHEATVPVINKLKL